MSVPDFDFDDCPDEDPNPEVLTVDIERSLAIVKFGEESSDRVSDSSPSFFSTTTGEEESDDLDHEDFAQLWEHKKKRLRITIIKKKTIKISRDESELRKSRKETTLMQQKNEVNHLPIIPSDHPDDSKHAAVLSKSLVEDEGRQYRFHQGGSSFNSSSLSREESISLSSLEQHYLSDGCLQQI